MHQIDNSSAVTNMPALGALGTPGWFTPGDPGGAQDSTIVDSDWANAVQAELLAVLTAAGIAWDKTKLNQIATAIQALGQLQAGNYGADTGAANAYVVTLTPAVTARLIGVPIRFKAANTNNGASTINYGAGAIAIQAGGAALSGNEIVAGKIYTVIDDGTVVELVGSGSVKPGVPVAPLVAVGSITLDASYVGRMVTDNAGGVTVTLPPANSVGKGDPISFIQQQGGVFTQLPNGADTFMTLDEWNGTSHVLTALGQTVTMVSDGVSKWYAVATSAATDVGKVDFFATSFPLPGWLVCDGSAVSRTTYAKLFTRISTDFGAGDGATTFNLPDLRGEFIRGFDNGRGVDSGRTFGSWQGGQIQSHSHDWGVNDQGQTAGSGSPGWGGPDGTGTTSAVGGNETRPRNVALLACIKY